MKVYVTSMSKLLSCVQDMFDIIDSYEYREQLLMPKLVITAANDEFFLPTDSRYWWADMLYCTVLYCTVLYCTPGTGGRTCRTRTSSTGFSPSPTQAWRRILLVFYHFESIRKMRAYSGLADHHRRLLGLKPRI